MAPHTQVNGWDGRSRSSTCLVYGSSKYGSSKIPRTHWCEDFFRDSRVIKAPNVTWEKVREIDLYSRWELRYAHLDTRKVTAILELS